MSENEKGAKMRMIDIERLFNIAQANVAKQKTKEEVTEFLNKLADEKLYPLEHKEPQYNECYGYEVLIPWFQYDENGYYVPAGTLNYTVHIIKKNHVLSDKEIKKQINDVEKDYLTKIKEREEKQREVEAVE